jgi:ribonuclease J
MASDGILVVIANIDMKKKELLIHPNITTRGFVLINENEALIKKIENMAEVIILNKLKDNVVTFNDIKSQITADLFPYIYELTGRKHIILPVILDIKR